MSINQEFKNLISKIKFFYGIKQSDIAFNIDVKPTYLSDMINGRVPVTESITEKLYEHYSDIKNNEVIKSEITARNLPVEEKYRIIENPEDIPEQFRKWVKPFYPDMKVGAGMNNGNFPVATKYFILVPFSENVEFWLPVEGKSMIPRYNHGDLVGVSEMHFDGVFSNENYVVLLNSNSWHLKQVELINNEDFVMLNSYNKDFPPKKMDINKISTFFKVRMFIGNE